MRTMRSGTVLRFVAILAAGFAADSLMAMWREGQIAAKLSAVKVAKQHAAKRRHDETSLRADEAELLRKFQELQHEIKGLQGNRRRIVEEHAKAKAKTGATSPPRGQTGPAFKMNQVLRPPHCTPRPTAAKTAGKKLPVFVFVVRACNADTSCTCNQLASFACRCWWLWHLG